MPLTGYLKIEDVPGESTNAQYENQIDIFGARWSVEQAASSMTGRTRTRADMSPLRVHKYYDRSSPDLARFVEQGRMVPEVVFTVTTDSGGTHVAYLIITMTNCIFVSYGFANEDPEGTEDQLVEQVEIDFEKVEIKYAENEGNGTTGQEHTVTLGGVARAISVRGFAPR